jgi:outer membrane protein assembly factor BamB
MSNLKLYCVSVIIAIVISGCNPAGEKNYSIFRSDVTHSSNNTSESISKKPELKWRFKTGAAVISSGTLFGEHIYFGSNDSCVYCLDKSSGKEIWKFKTNGKVCSTPAVTKDITYALSYDGNLYALNSADGSALWKYQTDGEKCFSARGIHGRTPRDSVFADDWDFFLSSPAVADHSVYFGTGFGYLYSVDMKSGMLNWKFKTNGIIHCSPALAYDNVYFGSWDTYFYAVNSKTGKEVWKYKTGEDTVIYNQTGFQGSPVISDSIVYTGCRDSYLYALNAISGKKIWSRFNDFAWISSTPLITGGKIIYTTGDSRSLVILDKLNGDSISQTHAPGWMFSSPSLMGSLICFGDMNGILSARDTNGKIIWTYALESSAADSFNILNKDFTLKEEVVFDKKKRNQEGKTSMEMIQSLGSIISSPVIEGRVIYFGSTDGYFYAMKEMR